jgi:hypothetical protein
MKGLLLLPLLLLTIFTDGFAQYYTNQNKVWVFGKNAGLDFNSGSPVPFLSGLTKAGEGTASVSNSDGELLFYTDGKDIYNKNHIIMPNGANIVPFEVWSTTQAALIIPVIGIPFQYYVFSLQYRSWLVPQECKLVYCKVDMAWGSSFGDVLPFTKGKFLQDSLSEKMIAVTGNNNNIWLLTHLRDTAVFLAYEIKASGISPNPVVSNVGTFTSDDCYTHGEMKISPNRKKLVSQSSYGTELYDFDPSTGIISNCKLLDTLAQYGAEFSPDNSKLYTNEMLEIGGNRIYQYDVSSEDIPSILSSKVLLATSTGKTGTQLKLAPNHKIYLYGQDQYLDCINKPNLPGSACEYTVHALALLSGTYFGFGLPNLYVTTDTLAWANVAMINPTPIISLFPNPTSAQLSISSSAEIEHITIFDITGRQVHSEYFNSKTATVDVSKLGEGIYLVNINGTITRTFVKR